MGGEWREGGVEETQGRSKGEGGGVGRGGGAAAVVGMERRACVAREALQRRMLPMTVRRWEFGWMGGGQIKGGRGRRQGNSARDGAGEEAEVAPLGGGLFRMACCQPLMTELK